MAAAAAVPLGSALNRPAISQDGKYVALVHPAQTLQILHTRDGDDVKLLFDGPLPKISAAFLSHLLVLKWAPVIEDDVDTIPWLLMSDGSRVVVVNPETLGASDIDARNDPIPIVADYQLGEQFGKLTYADFFLSQHHVIVLFETSGSASMLCTSSAQRDDIANIKSTTPKAVVRSHNLRSLLVLQRVKGQDHATLLGVDKGSIVVQSSFSLPTSDVQGAMFSPNRDPILAVWDSPAHGMAIYFFSSMGHPLRQLTVSSFGTSTGIEGPGLSSLRWASDAGGAGDTVLAIADSNKQVLIRRQNSRNMSAEDLGPLHHPATIDGSRSIVWQQMEDDTFSLQKRALDAVLDGEAGGDMSFLELSADQTFVATTPVDNPKSVWLWQPEHPDPHTVIVLRDSVRQLLWHPRNADVLVITTLSKTPQVFAWYSESKPPSTCAIPLANSSSSKFEGAWLEPDVAGRHAFAMSTTRAISIGHLEEQAGEVRFHSVLREDGFDLDLDGDTTSMSTPSKPSKKVIDADGVW